MRSFAILLLATAVLAAPEKKTVDPKKQDKRSLGLGDAAIAYGGLGYSGLGYHGLGYSDLGYSGLGYSGLGYSGLGYSGLTAYPGLAYSGLGTKLIGSGVAVGSNSLASAYASGLEYGNAYNTFNNGDVILGSGAPVLAHTAGLGVLPNAKTEHITGLTVHREVQVPVPVPHPVPVEVTKHVPVPQPVPVKVDRPYAVPVPQPVAVPVTRHVPVKVDRPYPVPVPHPVEVRVPQPVAVPVAQPVPVPFSVTKHVPVSVPSTFGVASSHLAVAPSTFATSSLSSGLAHAITSGHEYVDFGASHLSPAISGATLSNGFNPVYDASVVPGAVISSGSVSSINSGLAHPAAVLNAHNIPYGVYSTPLKKW